MLFAWLDARATEPLPVDSPVVSRLARSATWLRLLHYQKVALSGGWKSQIQSPSFFLASSGATDPQAELDETIRLGFESNMKSGDQDVLCRFGARYEWLADYIPELRSKLEGVSCLGRDQLLRELGDINLYVSFAESDVMNPISAFGHTFLVIAPVSLSNQETMLAPVLNFAADRKAKDESSFMWVIKGATGFSQGRFGEGVYFRTLNEYTSRDHRNVWQYRLTMSRERQRLLLLHALELRGVEFQYQFFSENCSSTLYALVMLGDERDDAEFDPLMTKAFVAPIEVIRQIYRHGLVDETLRISSIPDAAEHLYDSLDSRQQRSAAVLADLKTSPKQAAALLDGLGPGEGCVIDTAMKIIEANVTKANVDLSAAGTRSKAIQLRRTQLDCSTPSSGESEPGPEVGHGIQRLGLGILSDAGKPAGEMSFRLAYHDFLDNSVGFSTFPGELQAGDFRISAGEQGIRLRDATLLDITYRPLFAAFPGQASWRVAAGFHRLDPSDMNHDEDLGFRIEGGYGWPINAERLGTLSAGVTGAFVAKSNVQGGYDFRAGYAVEWLVPVSGRLELRSSAVMTVDRDSRVAITVISQAQLSFGENDGIRLEGEWDRNSVLANLSVQLQWVHYM